MLHGRHPMITQILLFRSASITSAWRCRVVVEVSLAMVPCMTDPFSVFILRAQLGGSLTWLGEGHPGKRRGSGWPKSKKENVMKRGRAA